MRFSFAVLAFASCCALAPALARAADSVDLLQANGVDLSVKTTTPGAQTVASQTDLTTQISALQTHIELGLQTGQTPVTAGVVTPVGGWWNTGTASLSATWTPTTLAKVEVGAQNSLRFEADPGDPLFADAGERTLQSRQTAAHGSITLTPASPLNLTVGAGASEAVQDSQAAGAASVDRLETQAQQLFTQLEWKPASLIALDAGGKVESTGVYWAGARAGSFAALDPSIGATLKPWTGAAWRFTLARAATPLSTDQFIGYASAVTPTELVNLQPNREWRYEAALEQKAGAIDLTASFTQARLATYAYLAPYGSTAGRVDMGVGDRSEVQAGLAAPLPVFGLAPFTLAASGAWRESQAQDPLTGQTGRLSGESPYDASLSLSQAVGVLGMRWGMTAHATGPARSYLTSQVTTLSATAGLGGFLEYRPGPVTLQLQLDNLVGGDRAQQDVYYAGPRDLSVIDRTDALHTTDRTIRLSISRAL